MIARRGPSPMMNWGGKAGKCSECAASGCRWSRGPFRRACALPWCRSWPWPQQWSGWPGFWRRSRPRPTPSRRRSSELY